MVQAPPITITEPKVMTRARMATTAAPRRARLPPRRRPPPAPRRRRPKPPPPRAAQTAAGFDFAGGTAYPELVTLDLIAGEVALGATSVNALARLTRPVALHRDRPLALRQRLGRQRQSRPEETGALLPRRHRADRAVPGQGDGPDRRHRHHRPVGRARLRGSRSHSGRGHGDALRNARARSRLRHEQSRFHSGRHAGVRAVGRPRSSTRLPTPATAAPGPPG